ncbi:MAG: glycosyltransferase [Pseudomonadota bacterium]
MSAPIAVVIIGRNEGQRLIACLASLAGQNTQIVYVDSGSDDGSQAAARAAGAHVIDLDTTTAFTAARARNAGADYLATQDTPPEFVQFVDGDCALDPDWLAKAQAFLAETPKAAVVFGRRRERFPEASIYNQMIDREWDVPVGQVSSCGGDALMRFSAFREAEGYRPDLIAGEEPELCVRLRAAGWTIWRIDAEMTLHDAALTRFSQWWQRNRRAGHAYAEGAAIHGSPPERHGVRETRSALIWGPGLLTLAILGSALTPWLGIVFLAWPLQILRLLKRGEGWPRAAFLVLGKFPEAQGVLDFWWNRLKGQRRGLIEYK